MQPIYNFDESGFTICAITDHDEQTLFGRWPSKAVTDGSFYKSNQVLIILKYFNKEF